MSRPELTIEDRKKLVLAAIDTIKKLHKQFIAINADASSSSADRMEARRLWQLAEIDFRWQWANVELILRGENYGDDSSTDASA